MPALAAFLSSYSIHSHLPRVKEGYRLPDSHVGQVCPCSLRSFLAMNLSWCPAVWFSGGLFYGSFPQIFPLLLLLKFH